MRFSNISNKILDIVDSVKDFVFEDDSGSYIKIIKSKMEKLAKSSFSNLHIYGELCTIRKDISSVNGLKQGELKELLSLTKRCIFLVGNCIDSVQTFPEAAKVSRFILSYELGKTDAERKKFTHKGLRLIRELNGDWMIKDKKLGEGSFKKVYRVFSLGAKKFFARASSKTKHTEFEEAKKEAKSLGNIRLLSKLGKHENIAAIYKLRMSYTEKTNRPKGHIYSEYCEGDLFSYIQKKGKLHERFSELAEYLRGCFSALTYMQQRGFVHGDIKAENIFLKEGKALLADLDGVFEEAKGVRETAYTDLYLPLEAFTKENFKLNHSSDLYALALTSIISFSYHKKSGLYYSSLLKAVDEEKPSEMREVLHLMLAAFEEQFEGENFKQVGLKKPEELVYLLRQTLLAEKAEDRPKVEDFEAFFTSYAEGFKSG